MIQKILSIIVIALFIGNKAMAQQEERVNLEATVKEEYKSDLGYSLVAFKLTSTSDNNSRVEVSIENLQPSETLILFHSDKTEKQLKKGTPKLLFDKAFGGDKGRRSVSRCSEGINYTEEIAPSSKTKFNITVNNEATKVLTIPFYFVKTERTWWGGQRTKILREEIVKYNITVTAWNENNKQFVTYRDSVVNLIECLRDIRFCAHKQHTESIEMQQQPYKSKIENLKDQIDIVRRGWTSDQSPHKSYSRLIETLNNINLDNNIIENCGKHHVPVSVHKCSYCSLSEVEISHQLNDLYIGLLANKITKEEASKKASVLYQCYDKNKKRKKTTSHKNKIGDFYNRIVGK